MKKMYENEVLDLPYNQDVRDYLQFKVFYPTFISRDPYLIFRKFTSHAIIFQNNNTADTEELELMSMSGFLTCFYLLTFLTRRIKLR